MKNIRKFFMIGFVVYSLFISACQPQVMPNKNQSRTIVVTYSILGALVKELLGNQANVVVLIPDGQDPHEWEPSARDIETLTRADLIVQNGLGLEGGMEKAFALAKDQKVKFFTASEHITIRHVGKDEGIPSGDPDQALGAADPHLWMDPVMMKDVMDALVPQLQNDLQLDVSSQKKVMDQKLDALNLEIVNSISVLPAAQRKLVTGHESMGYFSQRYGFKLIGAIIPSLNSQAEVSASNMFALKQLIKDNQVKAVFSELGTPAAVSDTIGKETGIKVIELTTHKLPEDGSYYSFMRNLAKTIVDGLK